MKNKIGVCFILIILSIYSSLRSADRVMDVRECRVRGTQALWITGDFNKAVPFFESALAKDPDDYDTNLYFGMAYLTYCQPHDYKMAEKYISRAARKGKNVFNQYLLKLVAEKTGDNTALDQYRISIAELLKDGGDKDVQVRMPDLEFGRQQYVAMLESIPAMKLYVLKEGWLSKWAIEKFAGVGLRNHVQWKTGDHLLNSPDVTTDDNTWAGDMALYLGPDDWDRKNRNGIRLAESYWQSFVFEMLNDQHRERTTWIWMRSRSGKMTDEAYAILNRSFEQQTDIETMKFYFENWKPYCEKMGLPTDEAIWSPRNPYPEEAIYKVYTGYDKAYLDSKDSKK